VIKTENSLAGFTVVQSESLVIGCRDDLVSSVIKADACDMSGTRIGRPLRMVPWSWWWWRINSSFEDLRGF
jgi:hypothetical protein